MSQGTLELYKTSAHMSPLYRGTSKAKRQIRCTWFHTSGDKAGGQNPWGSLASALVSDFTYIRDLNSHSFIARNMDST